MAEVNDYMYVRGYENLKPLTWYELANRMGVVPKSISNEIASAPCVEMDEVQLEIAAEHWVWDEIMRTKDSHLDFINWLKSNHDAWHDGAGNKFGYESVLSRIKVIEEAQKGEYKCIVILFVLLLASLGVHFY